MKISEIKTTNQMRNQKRERIDLRESQCKSSGGGSWMGE
jgi:hypothetical protein